MPFIPEIFMSRGDFASFSVIWNTQVSHNFIEEYQEAYRHVFSQPGAHYSHIVFAWNETNLFLEFIESKVLLRMQ